MAINLVQSEWQKQNQLYAQVLKTHLMLSDKSGVKCYQTWK